MTKPSVSEASGSPQHSARDANGNQSHSDVSSAASSAAASREIFQGLFKDLGKQAMAMESILRLVCGKVDKLENWVTEMSFGMTELDLKLRNIAHNIEGTAANVDDVASVSRWAVPVEENPLDVKGAAATVIKKVGVGLHGKKKQMRMTGMVANILDQLTTVAETPVMVESESESHKGEDGGKKKKGKKAKEKEKGKADHHAVAGVGSAETVPVPTSKSESPREAEAKVEGKEKHKTHKKKKAETQQQAQPTKVLEELAEEKIVENPVRSDETVTVEVEKNEEKAVELQTDPKFEEISAQEPIEEGHEVDHSHREETNSKEGEPPEEVQADQVLVEQEPRALVVDAQHEQETKEMEQEITPEVVPVEEQLNAEQIDSSPNVVETPPVEAPSDSVTSPDTKEAIVSHEQQSIEAVSTPEDRSPRSSREFDETARSNPSDTIPQPQALTAPPSESQSPVEIPASPATPEFPASSASPVSPISPISPLPVAAATSAPSPELVQSDERVSARLPSSHPPPTAEEVAVPVTVAPSEHASLANAAIVPDRQQSKPAVRPDLPTIRLEPLPIPEFEPLDTDTSKIHDDTARVSLEATTPASEPTALLKKAGSKKLRTKTTASSSEMTDPEAPPPPTKKSSRKASIRQSISKRQPSLKKRRSQAASPEVPVGEPATQADVTPTQAIAVADATKPATTAVVEAPHANATVNAIESHGQDSTQEKVEHSDEDDDDDDDDDDEEDSSMLSSDSDGSVLDLGGGENNGASADAGANTTSTDKRMSSKMTRTLSALNKLKKANVLSPEEIAELKQRANQKWFRLRDHVKEKNKKDVTNILLKRKKNIFTVSNRIELLEEKSREVYASIKQLNMELKGKIEASTFESLRRHVHDVQASLQVLDQKISKGDIPTMANIKQLALETENLRVQFLEQLAFARDHCDANHQETLRMFEDEWRRVAEIETSMKEKLETLSAGFDAKILALPDYADALESIRRAIRKKADLKSLRELEAKLLGKEEESEDCLIRCLSCHKEVVNTNGHDTTNNGDDNDDSVVNSPHFKRVNPGSTSAKVYRSNVPLNAQPLVISESTPDLFAASYTDEPASTTPNAKSTTPSRRVARNEEPRPSPLSFIHVTATRAMAAATEMSRPISAPSTAIKKKTQPKNTQ